jgi:hypothetical protein
MATVAVALALTGGGAAYAANLVVRSSDIVNGRALAAATTTARAF